MSGRASIQPQQEGWLKRIADMGDSFAVQAKWPAPVQAVFEGSEIMGTVIAHATALSRCRMSQRRVSGGLARLHQQRQFQLGQQARHGVAERERAIVQLHD
jgi:hypothetical protein